MNQCVWHREQIRAKCLSKDRSISPFPPHEATTRIIVREFDPQSTIIIKGVGHIGDQVDSSNLRLRNSSTFGNSSQQRAGEGNGAANGAEK